MDHGFDGLGSSSLLGDEVNYTPSFEFGDSFDSPSLTADLPFTQVENTPSNEVQPEAPCRSCKKGAVKKVSMRAKNFSAYEDELLCSAYLNVSKDLIVGANQPIGGTGQGCISVSMSTRRHHRSGLYHHWSTGGAVSSVTLPGSVDCMLQLKGSTKAGPMMTTRLSMPYRCMMRLWEEISHTYTVGSY